MKRSFNLVDFKVAEADFFLDRLDSADGNLVVAQWYFSAFVSTPISIHFDWEKNVAVTNNGNPQGSHQLFVDDSLV